MHLYVIDYNKANLQHLDELLTTIEAIENKELVNYVNDTLNNRVLISFKNTCNTSALVVSNSVFKNNVWVIEDGSETVMELH
jgi:hypothetical protein